MPTLTPSSEAAATAQKAVKGGSTKSILVRMEQGLGKTSLPPTTPYFVNEIIGNSNLKRVQETIGDLKDDRDSVFRARAELDLLIPTLEKSPTLKPELKSSLLLRAQNLMGIIEQAVEVDTQFSSLEEKLAALEDQRLKAKQEHYKAIETAANPMKKAAELLQTDKISQATIETYTKEANQANKLFKYLLRKIGEEYTFLRDAVPGSLRMRTFQDLSKSAAPSIDQQPVVRAPGARGV